MDPASAPLSHGVILNSTVLRISSYILISIAVVIVAVMVVSVIVVVDIVAAAVVVVEATGIVAAMDVNFIITASVQMTIAYTYWDVSVIFCIHSEMHLCMAVNAITIIPI